MSELITTPGSQNLFRWRLLTTVSAFALLTSVYATHNAMADDIERPTIWIELGGQLERVSRTQDVFTAPFLEALQTPPPRPFGPIQGKAANAQTRRTVAMPDVPFDVSQPLAAQKPPDYNFGGEGKISFSPKSSDWIFSASVRYGRANGAKTERQQTRDRASYQYKYNQAPRTPYAVRFSNAQTKYAQSHAVLDFQVGHDVGLGIFGRNTQSTFDLGVRFAQFTSKSSVDIRERPQMQIYYNHIAYPSGLIPDKYVYNTRFQDYRILAHNQRSFHGIGPSLSWSGSAPFAGSADKAEFIFDWGVNAALLFGRQKVKVDRKDALYDNYQLQGGAAGAGNVIQRYTSSNLNHFIRARSVAVPNLGGFMGASLKFPNAKVSVGYRADFFLGAMDAGIAERHTVDMSFHGPFAKISIGLGD